MGRTSGGGNCFAGLWRQRPDVGARTAHISGIAGSEGLPVFDPRDKDFPFAALTMAAVPFAAMTLLNRPKKEIRPWRNRYLPPCFLVAAIYTGLNEGPDNWQSL